MDCTLRFAAFVLTASMVWPGVVYATDDSAKGAARELANEAKTDFDAGNFESAGTKFQRAYEIAKVPTLAVWAARSLVKRGNLVAASELYRKALLLVPNDLWIGDVQQEAQADAERELADVQPRIPKLCIRVEGTAADDVALTVDDAKVSSALIGIDMPTDPGRRHVVGKRGSDVVEQTVDLAEGDRKETLLTFNTVAPVAVRPAPMPMPAAAQQAATAPAPKVRHAVTPTATPPTFAKVAPSGSASSAQRTWGWVTLGIGVAGLLTGTVAGIVVMSDTGLRNDCPNGACSASKSDSVDTYNLMRNISTAGFIVGGVGAAVGATLLFRAAKHESEPHVAIWLGPSSAGVKGAF